MRELLALALLFTIFIVGIMKVQGKTLTHTCPVCGSYMTEGRMPELYFCEKCNEMQVPE